MLTDVSGWSAVDEYLEKFDIAFSRDHHLLCLQNAQNVVTAVICDLGGWNALDLVRRRMNTRTQIAYVDRHHLRAQIDRVYEGQRADTQQYIDSLDDSLVRIDEPTVRAGDDLLDSAKRGPIIRMVNMILFEAVKAGASDIHIQPSQERVVVRQRIDGVLFDSLEIPKHIQEQVLTRIKVLARMDIAEKRLPQDGRATIFVGQREIDLRIASLPTSHNERIVIRLLDKSARLYRLDELGMANDKLDWFRRLIQLDHGMVLVTGPTGSGKSTTLYASLLEVNTVDLNVLTIEDPIEYQMPGVSQTQTNDKKGMTFAAALRSVLRQDPDIIMVGEIRDHDTATMSVQAALTGHLVFSTLHTNDASGAVTRLVDLGIEPYLVSSSLVAVLAQRLVRTLCTNCRQPDDSDETRQRLLALGQQPDSGQLMRANGCDVCRGTGFRGRIGIFELLTVDDPIRSLIQAKSSAAAIRESAVAANLQLLRHDGLAKVMAGVTTVQEILRVSGSMNID